MAMHPLMRGGLAGWGSFEDTAPYSLRPRNLLLLPKLLLHLDPLFVIFCVIFLIWLNISVFEQLANVFPTYLVGSPLTRLELDEKAMQVDPNVTPRCNVHPGTTPSRLRTTLFTKIQQCAARVGSLWVIWVRLCCTTPAPGWHASSRTFERHSKHLGDKLVSGRDNLNEVQQVLCTRGTASSQEEKSILGLEKQKTEQNREAINTPIILGSFSGTLFENLFVIPFSEPSVITFH